MEKLGSVNGDGGPEELTAEELQDLKGEVKTIADSAQDGLWGSRKTMDDIRFCRWPGQSTDGRKHQDANDGKPPFPFEGGSDARIRTSDRIINVLSAVATTAASRANVTATGMEITDEGLAGKISTLIRWVLKNKLGRRYLRELKKAAQWMNGDSPAMAVIGVYWRQEWGLKTTRLTLDQLAEEIVRVFGEEAVTPEMLADLADLVMNPDRNQEALDFFGKLMPMVKAKRIRPALEAWRRGETAEFPEPYLQTNTPWVSALRLYEDIFLPTNTTDLQRARVIFHREFLPKWEVLQRAAAEEWAPDFVKKLIGEKSGTEISGGFEGKTAFPEQYTVNTTADGDTSTNTVSIRDEKDLKGQYELITAYFKAANQDGAVGVYVVPFSHFIDVAAKKKELLDYAHGQYPFVDVAREVLTSRLMDTRSVSEVVNTDQFSEKLLTDSYNDHTSINTLPPIRTPWWAGDDQVVIAPLAQIKHRRPDDYGFMKTSDYPATNDGAYKRIRQRVGEYFGLQQDDVNAELAALLMQVNVDNFLWSLADVLAMVVQLCQQYLTDEEIQRITGGDKIPIGRTVEEIQGKFDLVLDFDVRTLDKDYILKLAEALSKYMLSMDTNQTIGRDKLIRVLFTAINPVLAEATLRPVEEANDNEVKDEENNFAKIAAGIEPPMYPQGQNYGLRLETLLAIGEKNPTAFQKLDPTSQAILRKRLEHLEFQVQQEKNKVIGTLGAAPALGEQSA